MTELIRSKLDIKIKPASLKQYVNCINDLLESEVTCSLENFKQHGSVTCLEHSLSVSYYSYLVCRLFKMDFRSAARGGLLHDLFLYDWHKTKLIGGMHGFTHPYTALENANKNFLLNKKEKDIIVKHMWPLTIKLPRYKESFIVSCVDKYCATLEVFKFFKLKLTSYKETYASGI